tara:strand:- start:278 stop:877 length:600 start_codon:yes stop_codon:yes gene_type:complete
MTENKDMEDVCVEDLTDKFSLEEIHKEQSKTVYDNFIKSQLDLWVDGTNKEKKQYRYTMYKTIVKTKFEWIKGLERLSKKLKLKIKKLLDKFNTNNTIIDTKLSVLGLVVMLIKVKEDKTNNINFVLKIIKNKEYSPFMDDNEVKEGLYHNEKIDDEFLLDMVRVKNKIQEDILLNQLEYIFNGNQNECSGCSLCDDDE